MKSNDRYIDMKQFPHKNGKVSWKDSVGVIAEFFYNGERHTVELMERLDRGYFNIKIDNDVVEKAHQSKIKDVMFGKYFYEPNYKYNIGDIVNNLKIIEQCQIESIQKGGGTCRVKGYKCECLNDGYVFHTIEYDLDKGHGCAICARKRTVVGFNDVNTTHPEVVRFLKDKNDAYKYSHSSKQYVKVICPYCQYEKFMQMSELCKRGYVTCDICSDGFSYPNKFAHELFSQLSSQYLDYRFEYSPDWASKYRYDNYIKLLNGDEIIVEMDGSFHYYQNNIICEHDEIKNRLSEEHGIIMIRINCDYNKVQDRYFYIKTNIVQSLGNYFDLSHVDWEKCNKAGMSNFTTDVIEFYNNNPKLGLQEIAEHFSISKETLYNYLHIGEELNLCQYVRRDSSRIRDSKPIAMYDMNYNLIGVFKSAKIIKETYPKKIFSVASIRKCAFKNEAYKDYIFKFVTYEEYQSFDDSKIQKII